MPIEEIPEKIRYLFENYDSIDINDISRFSKQTPKKNGKEVES
jgi:hypothetical protein